MLTMPFQVTIQRSCETVYRTLADIAGYRSWLLPALSADEIVLTSAAPLRVGSTYVRRGILGPVQGTVVKLVPATELVFREEMATDIAGKRSALESSVRYLLTRRGAATRVECLVKLRASGWLLLGFPLFLQLLRQEQQRRLQALKVYLEARVR
jgi:Polyketide cyclase / dehydrase and lipid transport.